MPLLGNAILAVWNDVDPEIEDDFNDWYMREHVPERLTVPGINRARRYRADQGEPRYMAFYEAASMDVLTQGPYRTQLDNPTAWTQRIMPRFGFAQRGLCDVAVSFGDMIGNAAAVVHLTPEDGPRLRAWLDASLLRELRAQPQVVAVHLWTLAPGEQLTPTTALSSGAGSTPPIAWVIVVETQTLDAAAMIGATILIRDPIGFGASQVRAYPAYRLLYAIDPA